jgi:hypothetical protein
MAAGVAQVMDGVARLIVYAAVAVVLGELPEATAIASSVSVDETVIALPLYTAELLVGAVPLVV